MTEYQHEQMEALELVAGHLSGLKAADIDALKGKLADYLCFRRDVDTFLSTHFSDICTETCYQSRISACCTREGIITFFADVAVNVIMSDEIAIQALFSVLRSPQEGSKCIYLGEKGCLWQVKPLVCEMFLCEKAEDAVLKINQDLQNEWHMLKKREKTFRWPDQIVLFDELEQLFLDAGHSSPLMYLHNSPGLLRVKKAVGRKQ
ncbi:MAG: hypothetical protein DRH90_07360 [Deltaproteobacteria bacterium]|nr:MAG: hypothetical protein DRH90_07360 [Deltaproteobacteria bacterium]RLC18999.1 MAG: hypothetical protein DRI24_01510 [Deltaproteobacteria bacterium]